MEPDTCPHQLPTSYRSDQLEVKPSLGGLDLVPLCLCSCCIQTGLSDRPVQWCGEPDGETSRGTLSLIGSRFCIVVQVPSHKGRNGKGGSRTGHATTKGCDGIRTLKHLNGLVSNVASCRRRGSCDVCVRRCLSQHLIG